MRLILAELRGWQCRRAQDLRGGGGWSQWINATKTMHDSHCACITPRRVRMDKGLDEARA